jgi:ribosomal protein S30
MLLHSSVTKSRSHKRSVRSHLKQIWEKVVAALLASRRHCSWSCLYPVHGSLARAGKVKSQTPKVDKQEKKKTPKGRAKKRILYNRR